MPAQYFRAVTTDPRAGHLFTTRHLFTTARLLSALRLPLPNLPTGTLGEGAGGGAGGASADTKFPISGPRLDIDPLKC